MTLLTANETNITHFGQPSEKYEIYTRAHNNAPKPGRS